MNKVLVIESKPAVTAAVRSALEQANFEVITANDGAEGFSKFYESRPSVVIMADDLTPVDGGHPCCRLRQVSDVPIIILGTRDNELSVAKALVLGCDAYMPTRLNVRELVARVRALLRRYHAEDTRGGGGTGSPGNLTRTEFRLLSCLALSGGGVVTHPQLIREVWGGKTVTVDCLKFYVRRLRQKLAKGPFRAWQVINHWGVGYSLRTAGEGAVGLGDQG